MAYKFRPVQDEAVYLKKGDTMETLIISILTSFIVSTTMMHYHIHRVNILYKKYMDFEKSSVEEFAKSITSRLPKNSSQEE